MCCFFYVAMQCFVLFKAGTNGCALIGTIGSYTCIAMGVGCYFAMLCFVLFKAGTNGCALIGTIGSNNQSLTAITITTSTISIT